MILDNIKASPFEGVYFHHKDKSPKTEESIAGRTKLRRQRAVEIINKNHMISFELFKRYFGYSNPSNMYKFLNGKKKKTQKEIEPKLI